MKSKDILNIVLCGILIVVGGYFVIRLFKMLMAALATGASFLIIMAYIFSPIIIIVLLIMILVKMKK